MDEDAIQAGIGDLNLLALAEYHQSLADVVAEPDKDKVAERLGRLVGVLIKEPFADVQNLPEPSTRTGAYRSWHLKDAAEFGVIAAQNPWQYQLFDRVRLELQPSNTTYNLCQ
jgi:hypothetical protein